MFSLTVAEVSDIYNNSIFSCVDWNRTDFSINETSTKLVNILPYLDINQVGVQVIVFILLTSCISVCSTASRRKENRDIFSMPRGDTMFQKSAGLFKTVQILSLANECARPSSLDKQFPHEKCPEKWRHLGWTTPGSTVQPFRYKACIVQSHTQIEALCASLSYTPFKKSKETTAEYLLGVVYEHLIHRRTNSLQHQLEQYVRIHERAIYGSGSFNHAEWIHFKEIYNDVTRQLIELKIEDNEMKMMTAAKKKKKKKKRKMEQKALNSARSRRSSSMNLKELKSSSKDFVVDTTSTFIQ